MKVLHAPVNVGNQPWVLSREERRLGLKSDLVVSYGTWLQYSADRVLMRSYDSKSRLDRLRRVGFGLYSAIRYDVLHYYFGQSYIFRNGVVDPRMNFLDLRLARRLGKRIIMTLQGCDVRLAGTSYQRNAVTMCREGACGAFATCIASLDEVRRYLIEEILPLCDRVFFLNPELGHYVPGGRFLPYANVAVEEMAAAPPTRRERPLILHAPSDPLIKGSSLIEAALDVLRGHYDFEYRPVKGLPHAEAMALYREADLVIDQVLSGWYGGFAVEVMAMGKPVACYLRQEDMDFVPAAMRAELPVLQLEPARLAEDLAGILDRRSEWPAIGEASRRFVLRWHNPRLMARAMMACYAHPEAAFDFSPDPEFIPRLEAI